MDFSLVSLTQNDRGAPSLQNDKVHFLCPSLRASKANVAIHKFKQTLPQKFKQSLKNPNPKNCLNPHRLPRRFLKKRLAMTDISCHTERSEVSINLKCDFSALRRILNSVDFSPFYKRLKMTMFEIFCCGLHFVIR